MKETNNEERLQQIQLLVWPSPLLIRLQDDSSSDQQEDEGFVLGWIDDKEENTTLVVAGVEWLSSRDSSASTSTSKTTAVQNQYESLQRRVELLHQNQEEGCLCNINNYDAQLKQGFRIVAYYSRLAIITADTTKKWLKKTSLPHLVQLKHGYPSLLSGGEDTTQAQVLLYDPQKVFRHDNLCHPKSSFTVMLAQASSAKSFLGRLDRIQPSSAALKTKTTSTKHNAKSRIKEDKMEASNKTEAQQQSTWLKTLERHSMLACHVRTMRSRRARDINKSLSAKNRSCNNCGKPILAGEPSSQIFADNKDPIRNVLDLMMGVLFGILLVGSWSSWGRGAATKPTSLASSYFLEQQFLPEWLTWLENFPIGFKLNVPLTQSIGQEIRSLVILRHSFLNAIAGQFLSLLPGAVHPQTLLSFQVIVVCASAALGGSSCIALLMDALRLLTLHLYHLSEGFRYVYRTEVYLLGSMWRLFRGKKQNILRERTDSMEYDSMQLLLGSILFTMTLFLLTTILVYYAFFTLLNLVARMGTSIALWSLYVFLQEFPFGTWYLRMTQPNLFTAAVFIRNDPITASSSAIFTNKDLITWLEPVPQSFGSILASTPRLNWSARALKQWLKACLSDIATGKPSSKTLVESLVQFPERKQ